jgi:RNA polymerase sigma factor (sigma-70 family)
MKEKPLPSDRLANLSTCELLAECANNLRDTARWEVFYSRYRRKIVTYLWRAYGMSSGRSDGFARYADDWVQEFFTKLIQHDGRVLRSFRGTTEISVSAFLASIAVSIVSDHLRAQRANRRRAQLVSMDEIEDYNAPRVESDSRVSALLDLLDIENALKADEESKNPERDLLIFKLHFVEGLTAREIASIPTFNLTISGLEKVLNRLRRRVSRGTSSGDPEAS